MVQHHNNLLRLNESHPDIKFQNGGFGVKRTSYNFSRSPIDLTLEQTVNADAASQRTGIGAYLQIRFQQDNVGLIVITFL